MTASWMKRAVCLAGAVLAAGLPLGTWAQAWPSKQPIKLVAVFPPGGSVDQVARILSGPLSQQLGQSVVVENKGGDNTRISLAFNTFFKGTMGENSQLTELIL